jgi:acid phosphatase family membrane protein YuiD
MNFFEELIENKTLIVAAVAWLLAQLIKTVITLISDHRFVPSRVFGDGGMPSAHTATVVSLAVMVGHTTGYNSAFFAIALILAVVVMNDATGVRLEAGKHAASIKELASAVNGLFAKEDKQIKTEKLKLLVGHTPLQVFFGALIGVAVSVGAILIFKL